MAGFDLGDYVTVPEREAEFYRLHPEGRIVSAPPEVRIIGDRTFIEVTTSVYRTPDDPLPCVASAWEPFPGRTPYTKDSEMMNAETSAIGRALAAAGISVNRSLASAEEVRNRVAERNAGERKAPRQRKESSASPQRQEEGTIEYVPPAIAALLERMNALQPAPARIAAKQGFTERFGHPRTMDPADIPAAVDYVDEWEQTAPTFVAAGSD